MATSTSNNFSGVSGQQQLQPLQLLQSPHLFNATVELIEAVAERALTRGMTLENKHPLGLDLPQLHLQRTSLEKKHKAEQAQHAFYKTLKQCLAEFNINEENPLYDNFDRAAQQLVEDHAKITLSDGKVDAIKKESIPRDFGNRVFNDIVEVFASKPLTEITIDALKQKVKELTRLFPGLLDLEIETKLRQAINAHHSKQEFKKAREILTNPSPKAAELKRAKQKIEAAYKALKTKIEARLKDLRGEKYGDENSLLHKAYVAWEKAKKDKEKAKAEFDVVIGKVAPDLQGVDGEALVEYYQNLRANENKDGANKIEARLKELRGEQYGYENSLLHKAHVAFVKAVEDKEKAKAEFEVAIGKVAPDVQGIDDPVKLYLHFLANENNDSAFNIVYIEGKFDEYAKLKAITEARENSDKLHEEYKKVKLIEQFLANENKDGAYNIGYITGKYTDYKAKLKAFNEAQKNRDKLNEEFKKIARYEPGTENLNGGILHYINKTLEAGLDVETRKQMDKMAEFYRELSRTVEDNNRLSRSIDLHRIID